MVSPVLEVMQREFQRQFVAVRAQAAIHADGDIGEIRMLAEGFAGVHVGKMHFDKRDGDGCQRIAQRHAGMGVSRRIDDDEIHLVARGFVQPVDQGTFVVVLEGFDVCAGGFSAADQRTVDVVERGEAVMLGFAVAEQIEIGAVQHQNMWTQTGDRFGRRAAGSFSRHGGEFAVNEGKFPDLDAKSQLCADFAQGVIERGAWQPPQMAQHDMAVAIQHDRVRQRAARVAELSR